MKLEDVNCDKLAKIVIIDGFDNLVLADTETIKMKYFLKTL